MSRDKIDFAVVGVQKAGTTAMNYYLRRHPCLSLPKGVKEVHFFDNEEEYRDVPDFERYHAHFSDWGTNKLYGEVTPIYMYWKGAIKRMHSYNSEMKLIVVLRNPKERAYSHWSMEVERECETLPFYDALLAESARLESERAKQHRVFSYVDRGYYSAQLKEVYKYFSAKSVLVLKYEDLKDHLPRVLSQLAEFLGVAEFGDVEMKQWRVGVKRPEMCEDSKRFLDAAFHHEILELEKMLGRQFDSWKL